MIAMNKSKIVCALIFALFCVGTTLASTVTVRVEDISHVGIDGALISYGIGSNSGTYYFNGGDHKTGSSATGEIQAELPNGTYSFKASYNNGTKVMGPVVVSGDKTVTFQTVKYTVRLKECDTGLGIEGQKVAFGAGTNTNTSWAGYTDSAGELELELFPGVYSFNMYLNGTNKTALSQTCTAPTGWNQTNFSAVKVLLDHSELITYGGSTGISAKYTYGMYMLPGTIQFVFDRYGLNVQQQLYISGCTYEKAVAIVSVLSSDGSGTEVSAKLQWYNYGAAGTKYNAGDKWGTPKVVLIDPALISGDVVFCATRQNMTNTLRQDIYTNSIYSFQTVEAQVQVLDHDGNPQVGQLCEYYAWGAASTKYNGWFSGSDLLIIEDLLPGSYGFVLHHNYTTQNQAPVAIPGGNIVTFQTGLVLDGTFDCVKYYQYGNAGNKQNFWDGKELLPVKVIFVDAGGSTITLDPVPAGATTYLNVP